MNHSLFLNFFILKQSYIFFFSKCSLSHIYIYYIVVVAYRYLQIFILVFFIKGRETGLYFAIYSRLATAAATTIKFSLFISLRMTCTFLYHITIPKYFRKNNAPLFKSFKSNCEAVQYGNGNGGEMGVFCDYLSTPKRENHSSYVGNKTKG